MFDNPLKNTKVVRRCSACSSIAVLEDRLCDDCRDEFEVYTHTQNLETMLRERGFEWIIKNLVDISEKNDL